MPEADSAITEPADRTLVITRVFDAPRSVVFKAWTDPAHAMQWMGPRNYPVCHIEQDLRPGGAIRICLRPKDGGPDLWHGGVYREIVEPERLVFTFAWDAADGGAGPETLVTITFAEHQGKTKMTFHQALFDTPSNRDGHREGWTSSFDRLDEHLAAL